jgi:hypothetical protein
MTTKKQKLREMTIDEMIASVPPKKNSVMEKIRDINRKLTPFRPMDFVKQTGDFTHSVQQARPSQLLKLAGVASAQAPGVTEVAIGALPALGTPTRIMSGIQNIRQAPQQIPQALKRTVEVAGGSELQSKEVIPARAGEIAGASYEMFAPIAGKMTRPSEAVVPTGPFSAGVRSPSTVIPGSFEKAGEALTAERFLARAGESAEEAKRFRGLLATPKGTLSLAEEAKAALESGGDIAVHKLIAYKEALGRAMEKGGVFAQDFKRAKDIAVNLMKKKAPKLSDKIEKMAINYLAEGDERGKFPFLILAIDPRAAVAKTMTLPITRNIIGAMAGATLKGFERTVGYAPAQIGAALPTAKAISDLAGITIEKAREFLRKAKGNKEEARRLAREAGFDPTKRE